jgi:hypothetical protein
VLDGVCDGEKNEDGHWRGFGLTVPVCALRAEEFEDVDAAAAVGGLQNH